MANSGFLGLVPLILLGCGGSELPTGHVPALDTIEAKVEPVASSDWLEAHFAEELVKLLGAPSPFPPHRGRPQLWSGAG